MAKQSRSFLFLFSCAFYSLIPLSLFWSLARSSKNPSLPVCLCCAAALMMAVPVFMKRLCQHHRHERPGQNHTKRRRREFALKHEMTKNRRQKAARRRPVAHMGIVIDLNCDKWANELLLSLSWGGSDTVLPTLHHANTFPIYFFPSYSCSRHHQSTEVPLLRKQMQSK